MKKKFREIKQNRKNSEKPLFVPGKGDRRQQNKTRPTRFLPQDWKSKHWRVCTKVNKLGGAALSSQSWNGGAGATQSRGLGFLQDAQGKSLEPPRPSSSPSAFPVPPTRPPGRLPHLHQPAAPGNKVDGELILPPHHARRLRAAAAATATSSSPGSPRAAAPSPSARLPRSGPAPALRFRLPPPRPRPLIGHAQP